MIEEARGNIDYEETGTGPTMVLVPGSCSTGAAWRPVIAAWENRFRCVTTSLPGYGGTAERRTPGDASISHEAEALKLVIRKAGGRVHLVGHSFGGLVALAVALRGRARLASLTVIEAPAVMMLDGSGETSAHPRIRRDDGALFRRLQGWQGRRDRGADRLFRRRRHLCLVAAAGSRLCHGDNAGQHPRLGNRVRLSADGGGAGASPGPDAGHPRRRKSPRHATRQRNSERTHDPGERLQPSKALRIS